MRFSRATRLRLIVALGSSLLLAASFPTFNQPWCAWVALVPWLLLLRQLSGRQAFWWSSLIGFIFFLTSLWWLVYVTVAGWLFLCAYLAAFVGLFGLIAWRVYASRVTPLMAPLVIAPAWVALEFARSHLLSGFGWNLLAYSQTPWRLVIQVADLTGAWGLSFLIVMVNGVVAGMLTRDAPWGERLKAAAAAALGVLVTLGYGAWRIPQVTSLRTVRVAVLQGNIPQEEKWELESRASILKRYEDLTQSAVSTQPDLIVWPETSVPGYLGLEEPVTQPLLQLAAAVEIPLLVGAPMGHLEDLVWQKTNSAALLDAAGEIRKRYDKLHLVPFGEFIPFERLMPGLRELLPPIGDFIPGRDHTVFRLNATPEAHGHEARDAGQGSLGAPLFAVPRTVPPFSVLICFEDVFPELARRFVQEGAQMLLVITNDAWFGPTAAAYQHTQASAFRAVELRVPVARAANTGWSGCIDATGAWIGSVRDASGAELFVTGTHTCDLPLPETGSFYRRSGDWFAGLCVLWTVCWMGLSLLWRNGPPAARDA